MQETQEIPVWGRPPGDESGNPVQYSCLENPMEGGAWRAAVHRVAKTHSHTCVCVYVCVCVCVYEIINNIY